MSPLSTDSDTTQEGSTVTKTRFRGVVGGIEYDDPGLFETAARNLGFRRNKERGTDWKVGAPIAVRLTDGTRVEGQVWCRSETANYVWVALDNGTYVAVNTRYRDAYKSPSGDKVGKVAA